MNKMLVAFLCAGMLTVSSATAMDGEYEIDSKFEPKNLSANQRRILSASASAVPKMFAVWTPLVCYCLNLLFSLSVGLEPVLYPGPVGTCVTTAATVFLNPVFVELGHRRFADTLKRRWAPEEHKEYYENKKLEEGNFQREYQLRAEFEAEEKQQRELRFQKFMESKEK